MKCNLVQLPDQTVALNWSCPYCGHSWDFRDADLPTICFLVVHHLVRKHGLRSEEIVRRHAFLAAAVEEYTAPRRGRAGFLTVGTRGCGRCPADAPASRRRGSHNTLRASRQYDAASDTARREGPEDLTIVELGPLGHTRNC